MRVITTNDAGHLYTGEVEYDGQNNLKTFKEKIGTSRTPYQTDFTYNVENKPTLMTFGDTNNKVAYVYDALGRMSTRTVTVGGIASASTYSYVAGDHGTGSTTALVSAISQGNDESCGYTYDDVGNITAATRGTVTTTYAYDNLGQLIRANDPFEDATWVYNYDRGGNMTSKVRYAYTTGTLGTALQTISYDYDVTWKDKLTAYDGKAITYDAIGNPLTYEGWAFTWQNGRQLAALANASTTATFAYNADGLRIQKTVNGVVTDYTLHGKNVVHMTQGTNNLHFWYDAQNHPAIVDFNGIKCAYILNLQGDIVGLKNASGVEVVRYTYDAWGKLLETTGSLASTLGYMNPFRYRGYVYDEETGFYYLRSRYYNPKWDRFVNADSIVGSNQFTYCKSNPICKKDTNGNIGIGIFGPDGDEEEILFPELYEAQLRQQAVVQSNNREVRKTIEDYSFGIHAGLYPENRHVTVLALFSNFDSFISKKQISGVRMIPDALCLYELGF